MVTIVSSTSTWHWFNLIEHLGMKKNIVSLYYDIINMFWEHKNGNDDKYINVLVSPCSTVSVVYFFSSLFWDSDVWVSTHFDHWSNLKKVDWLCNWPHISLQPGWSSSLFGWIAFKELLRISWLFKLRHSYATTQTPLVHHLFYGGLEIWIQNGRRSREFSMLWPQLIPWVSPHSLISQP